MFQLVMPVVLLELGVDQMACLSNVDLTTLTGVLYSPGVLSSRLFLTGQKETRDLHLQEANLLDIVPEQLKVDLT
jgi:hypothetical protein